MQRELFYSRIIKDTVTEAFSASVKEVLIPILEENDLGRGGILFFDDHLADGFISEGMSYYPLTVFDNEGESTLWIKWPYGKKSFGATPFAYTGDGYLSFEIAEDVPEEFISRMDGRRIAPDPRALYINAEAAHPDPTFLSGKYSISFLTELSAKITERIAEALSVSGLEKSDIELQLVFAPGTYMEHTSEGVTYRRLLISAKGCQPRDFWVKWTSPSGAVYHVQDTPDPENISFDLGEDVPQKIREKEYRFLAGKNPEKYRAAMGKRTATEWREIIKLAVKRGALTKVVLAPAAPVADEYIAPVADEYIAPVAEEHAAPVAEEYIAPVTEEYVVPAEEDSFADIMEMARAAIGEAAPVESAPADTDGDDVDNSAAFDDIMEMARAAIGESAPAESAPADTTDTAEEDGDEDFADIMAMAMAAIGESDSEGVSESIFDIAAVEETEADEIEESVFDVAEGTEADEIEESVFDIAEETEADEIEESVFNVAEETEADEIEELVFNTAEETEADEAEESVAEEIISEPVQSTEEEARLREELIRAEIEAKLRLEYEEKARARAEEEAEKLRLEEERLRAELARRDEETERLRAELEATAEREARERERLAEAARLAAEEQRRLEAELEAREAREREEERLRAEAEAARLEEERILAEREREAERIRAEIEARRAAEEAAAAAAAEEAARIEAEEAARIEAEKYSNRRAKLMFRRTVDPAIINRIQEIIEKTLTAEGKSNVQLHIKAHLTDETTITLDVIKFPISENDLLISIIKAIGNGNVGIAKIILE